jgi:hypothetical protein
VCKIYGSVTPMSSAQVEALISALIKSLWLLHNVQHGNNACIYVDVHACMAAAAVAAAASSTMQHVCYAEPSVSHASSGVGTNLFAVRTAGPK